MGDYVVDDGRYILAMPNTCRYFTTASNHAFNRKGQIILSLNDKKVFDFVFCFINSSFAYWHWRLYDGGITYPKSLLMSLPMFYDKLTEKDKTFFTKVAEEMISTERYYIVQKNNVGLQENIKYPRVYRDKINKKILEILNIDTDEEIFDIIHSNMALEVSV